MKLQPALTRDPAPYMWEVAVTMAAKPKFRFSPQCEAGLKEQFKSGLEVYKVGLYEFRERIKEAETNIEKLVPMIMAKKSPAILRRIFFTIEHVCCPVCVKAVSRTLALC
jgi:hypothetical protein